MLPILSSLILLLGGCFQQTPVYAGITAVTIHHQTANGVDRQSLEGSALTEAVQCLTSTREIEQDQAQADFLQSIYLLEVSDRFGDRMFELYTDRNMKGNRGKYYENRCIYDIIRKTSGH